MRRRPHPMLVGLALLTTAAHAVVAGAHLLGGHGDWRDWPLLALLALAPVPGAVLAARGRARAGAALLLAAFATAAFWTLRSHFALPGDTADPPLYAWIVQMTLAFELQGAAIAALLLARPPRAIAAPRAA